MNWTMDDIKSKNLMIGMDGIARKVKTDGVAISRKTSAKSNEIFIPGNVPSSKNSRRFGMALDSEGKPALKANGKKITISKMSQVSTDYKKNSKSHWIENKLKFLKMIRGLEKPYRLEFFFVRNSENRIWDFHNMIQLPIDLMVDHKYLDGDDVKNVLIYPPLRKPYYLFDKQDPGLYIRVLKL